LDLSSVRIDRLKDKASPGNASWLERFHTWRLAQKPRVTIGRRTVLKRGTEVRICDTGVLTIGEHSVIHQNCRLLLTMPNPKVRIGRWVFVGMNTIIASKNSIEIGDYTIFAPNCYVVDHEHGFSGSDVILNQRSVLKEVRIGRDCYFGAGSVVLGGVTVGDGAVLGAGSIVKRDVPPYEIWAGNPAEFIRKRE
jgi:acetyltransferase-like isoleucine patch superfamily enzyme